MPKRRLDVVGAEALAETVPVTGPPAGGAAKGARRANNGGCIRDVEQARVPARVPFRSVEGAAADRQRMPLAGSFVRARGLRAANLPCPITPTFPDNYPGNDVIIRLTSGSTGWAAAQETPNNQRFSAHRRQVSRLLGSRQRDHDAALRGHSGWRPHSARAGRLRGAWIGPSWRYLQASATLLCSQLRCCADTWAFGLSYNWR